MICSVIGVTFPGADVGSDHNIVMMTFQTRLKNSRKLTQPKIRFDLEKLKDPTVMSAFQATVGDRFAPLATLVDEDADLDCMVIHLKKAVTDTAAELLGKQRRMRKPWLRLRSLIFVTKDEILRKREASQKEPTTTERLKERSGQRWRWQKRLGYRFHTKKWKHASERITARKHTS